MYDHLNIDKKKVIEEIEAKAEKALRALSDTDVELNEIIAMCKQFTHKPKSSEEGK